MTQPQSPQKPNPPAVPTNGRFGHGNQLRPALLDKVADATWVMVSHPALGSYWVGAGFIRSANSSYVLANHNNKNRPQIKKQIDAIKKCLEQGTYHLNGDTVIFDRDGELCNGQHRYVAQVESGVPLPTFFVYGVDPESFLTVDNHGKRTLHHVLAIQKYTSPKELSAVVSCLRGYTETGVMGRGGGFAHVISIQECVDFLRRMPHLEKVANRPVPRHLASLFRSGANVSALHYLFGLVNPELADDFFDAIQNKSIPREQYWDGVRQLYNQLDHDRVAAGRKMMTRHVIAKAIKAWNALAARRWLKNLYWDSNKEDFPKIAGLTYDEDGCWVPQ